MGSKTAGFSLSEVAIVIAISGLALAGIVPLVTTIADAAKYRAADEALASIRAALFDFATTHGRLPCPADPTLDLTSGDTLAGRERVDTSSPLTQCLNQSGPVARGALPFAEIGVPPTDAWGRQYSYWVLSAWSAGGTPRPAEPTLQVWTRASPASAPTLAVRDPLVVVVSHGPSGRFGWSARGIARSSALPATTDEALNDVRRSIDRFPIALVDREPTPSDATCGRTDDGARCGFDHRVATISRSAATFAGVEMSTTELASLSGTTRMGLLMSSESSL